MEVSIETAWRKVLIYGRRRVPYSILKRSLANYPDILAAARSMEYELWDLKDPKVAQAAKRTFAVYYKNKQLKEAIWQ